MNKEIYMQLKIPIFLEDNQPLRGVFWVTLNGSNFTREIYISVIRQQNVFKRIYNILGEFTCARMYMLI
jgi:hypothetical protein